MLFSKKGNNTESISVESVTLADLKNGDPEGYKSLLVQMKADLGSEESQELISAKATIEKLTKAAEAKGLSEKILSYGKALGTETIAKEAIESKSDFPSTLIKMVDAHLKGDKNIEESFDLTASQAGGVSSDIDDSNDVEPKTFSEAINLISSRDNITKVEASEKAKLEYPKIFNKLYGEGENK